MVLHVYAVKNGRNRRRTEGTALVAQLADSRESFHIFATGLSSCRTVIPIITSKHPLI